MENLKAPIDWSSVDFVTDRSNLRKLLRWIKGTGEEVKREFRIDLQLAGERTVLMTRWERINQTSRRRKLAEHHTGIGHNFEKESTVPAKGCERGISHHRIVKYVSMQIPTR